MEIQKEYERLRVLFDNVEEKQLKLVDGAIWETARLRVELNALNEIVKETGLVKVHQERKELQKELPVSKLIIKARANYLNYIAKLSNILGKNIIDDEEILSDYE